MKKGKPTDRQTVTGIVIANEWDAHGNVTGVAIYTGSEKIYLVAKNEWIPALLDARQQQVKVQGKITRLPDGHERIDVQSLQIQYRRTAPNRA